MNRRGGNQLALVPSFFVWGQDCSGASPGREAVPLVATPAEARLEGFCSVSRERGMASGVRLAFSASDRLAGAGNGF